MCAFDHPIQVATFGNADRDPRGRYMSGRLYAASVPPEAAMWTRAGDDAANAAWFPFSPSFVSWPEPCCIYL